MVGLATEKRLGDLGEKLYDDRLVTDAEGLSSRIRQPRGRRADNTVIGNVSYPEYSKIVGPDGKPFRTNVTKPIYGTDGYSAMSQSPAYSLGGAAPNAKEGEPSGFFRSWFRYRKRLAEEMPIVRWKYLGNYWKVPVYSAVSKIAGAFNTTAPKDRDTLFKIAVGGLLDVAENNLHGVAKSTAQKCFPRIRAWTTHAEGGTNISRMYIYSHIHGGVTYELPIGFEYFEGGVRKTPDVNTLKENIQHIIDHNESTFNKNREMESYLNKDWVRHSANKVTRWDYERHFEEESWRFNRHVIKPYSWYIHQHGQRDTVAESALDPSLPTSKIKIFKTPVDKSGFWYNLGKYLFADDSPRSGSMFWYSILTDLAYDVVDTLYDPFEDLMESIPGMPREAIRYTVFNEWRIATDAVRSGFRNPGRRPLTYEITT